MKEYRDSAKKDQSKKFKSVTGTSKGFKSQSEKAEKMAYGGMPMGAWRGRSQLLNSQGSMAPSMAGRPQLGGLSGGMRGPNGLPPRMANNMPPGVGANAMPAPGPAKNIGSSPSDFVWNPGSEPTLPPVPMPSPQINTVQPQLGTAMPNSNQLMPGPDQTIMGGGAARTGPIESNQTQVGGGAGSSVPIEPNQVPMGGGAATGSAGLRRRGGKAKRK